MLCYIANIILHKLIEEKSHQCHTHIRIHIIEHTHWYYSKRTVFIVLISSPYLVLIFIDVFTTKITLCHSHLYRFCHYLSETIKMRRFVSMSLIYILFECENCRECLLNLKEKIEIEIFITICVFCSFSQSLSILSMWW